jgi:two-component system sensor histidine kinase RegB
MKIILKYLLLLRGVTILGQMLALVVISERFGFSVPWVPVAVILVAMTGLTLWSWRQQTTQPEVTQREFVAQLLADIIALSVLVYFTGGSLNPFISLFLLPIIFAAAALPPLHTAIVAIAASAAYTALMFTQRTELNHLDHTSGINIHLWGMWYGFLLSAACVAAFVARIARALRERDAALIAVREQALRDERIVALGTLAAGTAHELGTPLSTMMIVAQELAEGLGAHAEHRRSVDVLVTQIRRCKDALSHLAQDAGELPASAGQRTTLAEFLATLAQEFHSTHPDVRLDISALDRLRTLDVVVDRTLRQALLNVLNNAADAAHDAVQVHCDWNADMLRVDVIDDGSGITSPIRSKLGKQPVSTKGEAGMGLGAYLATTVIQRGGGRVDYLTPTAGGTRVRIHLPLTTLNASLH